MTHKMAINYAILRGYDISPEHGVGMSFVSPRHEVVSFLVLSVRASADVVAASAATAVAAATTVLI